MTRLCTICARGGSKGVPGKNIRPLGGLPLIAHSIAQARDSGLFALVAVSSDDPAILDVARAHGADLVIHRPDHLASDTAAKCPAIRHAQQAAEAAGGLTFTTYVDLDATAPLRLPADIAAAVALQESTGCSSVVTACPARRSPYFNLLELGPDGAVVLSKPPAADVVRRQDSPPCFDMNGSVYVWRPDAFAAAPQVFFPDTRLLVMPEYRSVDIDAPLDFDLVELILARGLHLDGTASPA